MTSPAARQPIDRRKSFDQIIERGDPAQCRYCAVDVHRVPASHGRCAHIEHLTPVSRGGTNDLANLGLSCGPCNLAKGTLTEVEHRWAMTRPSVTAEDVAAARQAGRLAAEQDLDQLAPTDPALRIAWSKGYKDVNAVDQAINVVRRRGVTWREIAEALGENHNTVRVRYTQPDRTSRWKARRDSADD